MTSRDVGEFLNNGTETFRCHAHRRQRVPLVGVVARGYQEQLRRKLIENRNHDRRDRPARSRRRRSQLPSGRSR